MDPIKEIRERRSRADAEATKLRFPDELAPRWQDVDVLLGEIDRLVDKALRESKYRMSGDVNFTS